MAPPDALLLQWSLVSDKAVPPGHEKEFAALEPAIQKASAADIRRSTRMCDMSSAVWLHQGREAELDIPSEEIVRGSVPSRCTGTSDTIQGEMAAVVLRRTARRDAEVALRSKWVEVLASLPRGTPTPMGELLNKGADNLKLLGGGRSATTLRARGRTVKKFLAWLTLAHEVPTEVQHLSEYLQMRHSEPCTRGGLKGTHQAFAFMEEIAAVEVTLTHVFHCATSSTRSSCQTLSQGGTKDRYRASRQSWSRHLKTRLWMSQRGCTFGCPHGGLFCNVGAHCVARIIVVPSQTRSLK